MISGKQGLKKKWFHLDKSQIQNRRNLCSGLKVFVSNASESHIAENFSNLRSLAEMIINERLDKRIFHLEKPKKKIHPEFPSQCGSRGFAFPKLWDVKTGKILKFYIARKRLPAYRKV